MKKSIYFKCLSIALIFLSSIYADDIVGVWKVDKEKAISAIRNIVPEEERFLIERLITHGLFKELDFKEDGVLVYPLVSDVNATWEYDKSKNKYLVKAVKDVGQIELSDKNNFVFKNLLGKKNLDIDYKRIAYSEIRRQEIEDKSKIYMNKVYHSDMVRDGRYEKGFYHYIIFTDEYSFYDIEATSKDIGASNLLDIKRIIKNKDKRFDKRFNFTSSSDYNIGKSIDESISDPIKGYTSSGYKIKNNLLIPSYNGEFSSISDDPKIEKTSNGVNIELMFRPCKQIQIVIREHLKCDNGMEYFLLDESK